MAINRKIPVFFCIPDITGFTRFMTNSDEDFAHLVIPKILKALIKSNNLGFSIAEIEGDAIFFYKTGRLPAIQKVAQQCKTIYEAFNNVISSFKESHPKEYDLYLANEQLGLKIIIHCGKISIAKIEGRTKLIGEDVIMAHKLLKNKVSDYNYILLTDGYLKKLRDKKTVKNWFNWEQLKTGFESYEHFDHIDYHYISLNDCNNINKRIALLPKSPMRRLQSHP